MIHRLKANNGHSSPLKRAGMRSSSGSSPMHSSDSTASARRSNFCIAAFTSPLFKTMPFSPQTRFFEPVAHHRRASLIDQLALQRALQYRLKCRCRMKPYACSFEPLHGLREVIADNSQAIADNRALGAQSFDCRDAAASGCHQILDQYNPPASHIAALHALPGAVLLQGFSNKDRRQAHRKTKRRAMRDAGSLNARNDVHWNLSLGNQRFKAAYHLRPLFRPKWKPPIVAVNRRLNARLEGDWRRRQKGHPLNRNQRVGDLAASGLIAHAHILDCDLGPCFGGLFGEAGIVPSKRPSGARTK